MLHQQGMKIGSKEKSEEPYVILNHIKQGALLSLDAR